jgi:hypothetical protein
MAKRSYCPVCNKDVAVKIDGTLMKHGQHREGGKPRGEQCKGTGTPTKRWAETSSIEWDRRQERV